MCLLINEKFIKQRVEQCRAILHFVSTGKGRFLA